MRTAMASTTRERYAKLKVEISGFRASGLTYAQVATKLNVRGDRTFRGHEWNTGSLCNLLQRQGGLDRSRT